MDLNNEAVLNGSEQSSHGQSPIAIVPAPAGEGPMDARAAARSLADMAPRSRPARRYIEGSAAAQGARRTRRAA